MKEGIRILAVRAWKLMSRYVRLRDMKKGCITCGKSYVEICDAQAGHFKHAAKTNPVSYDFRNINAQCISCNSFGNGKLDVYAERLVEMYGPEVLTELTQLKKMPLKGKDKKQFFVDKIAELTEKLKEVEG